LRVLRRRFQSNFLAARDVIAKHFPANVRVSEPVGGCVLWIDFPAGMDSLLLFEEAAERGITIAPGPMFSASHQFRNCIRIGLGGTWTARHAQGLREVGHLSRRMLGE
jgi:DNA-binding transcriptional MocR family regulator